VSARRTAVAFALVVVIAAAPAAAFVRSTTAKPADPTQGACLWWPTKQVPYHMNASGFHSGACADGPEAVAKNQSFRAWSAPACTDFTFIDGGDTPGTVVGNDGENRILVRQGACSAGCSAATCNCWEHGANSRTIALTTVTFQTTDGKILDADMELFSWDGTGTGALSVSVGPGTEGWYFSCGTAGPPCQRYGDAGCLYIDLGHTVTHEAGHMLGLDHPCAYSQLGTQVGTPGCAETDAIMFASANPGDTRRTLTPDDQNGVCAIYPRGNAVDKETGCFGQAAQQQTAGNGGAGCASAGAGELALLSLVPLALRRRSRKRNTPRSP
jgi:hypothetical protein